MQITTKFTPGPWWASMNSADAWGVNTLRDGDDPKTSPHIGTSYGASICINVGDHTEQRTRGNEEANAHLIAAAPELYEACMLFAETALALSGDSMDYALPYAKAKAALAKARGEG